MRRITSLSAATAIALVTAPAAAQEQSDGLSWQDIVTPQVRFVQTDADGNVMFDSDAPGAQAAGADDPATRRAIERADGETTAATDEAMPQWRASEAAEAAAAQGMTAESFARDQIANLATEGTEDPMAGSPMAGDLSEVEGMTSPSGEQFDMQEFAQELFREGYRQGYVSGMTQMRTQAARQMMSDRPQYRQFRQQAEARSRMQERQMDRVLSGREAANASGRPQMQREADGTTVIVLPAGMSPRDFIRAMNR